MKLTSCAVFGTITIVPREESGAAVDVAYWLLSMYATIYGTETLIDLRSIRAEAVIRDEAGDIVGVSSFPNGPVVGAVAERQPKDKKGVRFQIDASGLRMEAEVDGLVPVLGEDGAPRTTEKKQRIMKATAVADPVFTVRPRATGPVTPVRMPAKTAPAGDVPAGA